MSMILVELRGPDRGRGAVVGDDKQGHNHPTSKRF